MLCVAPHATRRSTKAECGSRPLVASAIHLGPSSRLEHGVRRVPVAELVASDLVGVEIFDVVAPLLFAKTARDGRLAGAVRARDHEQNRIHVPDCPRRALAATRRASAAARATAIASRVRPSDSSPGGDANVKRCGRRCGHPIRGAGPAGLPGFGLSRKENTGVPGGHDQLLSLGTPRPTHATPTATATATRTSDLADPRTRGEDSLASACRLRAALCACRGSFFAQQATLRRDSLRHVRAPPGLRPGFER